MNLRSSSVVRLLLPVLAAVIGVVSCYAQTGTDIVAYEEDDDISIREDSVVIEGWDFEDFEVKIPRFVKLRNNHIIMNGANWNGLRKRLSRHDTIPFSIVHIGDSHLQADISTGYLRSQLQFDYGDAGRGLIAPLKLSRTNEPVDYYFRSDHSWSPLKFMSANWPRTMGFTGTSLTPSSSRTEITVGSRVTDTYSTFTDLTLMYCGDVEIEGVTLDDGTEIPNPAVVYSDNKARILLPKPTGKASVIFRTFNGFSLFGAYLSGARPGIFYNVIGNNGATYSSYNRVPQMGHGVASMHPDLIIISLGTNEAFGRFDEARQIDAIDKLIKDLRRTNPGADFLLVTPMECQRRSGKGFIINRNVKSVRYTILQYGKDHHIPVYDWYEIAGGDGASGKWVSEGLFGRDRIHHTVKGYRVEGFMLYDALIKEFNRK